MNSTKICTNLPILTKTKIDQYVSVPIPISRRERRKPTSFTIPPSLRKRLKAYAKRADMSMSDLVIFMCVRYLEAIGQTREGSKGSMEAGTEKRSQPQS